MINPLWPYLVRGAQAAGEGTFWLPPQASTYASDTDFTFYYIYYVSVVCFIILMGAMIYFAVAHRQKTEGETVPDIKGSHALEIGWSVLPGLLMIVMFWLGFQNWMNMAVPPADSYEIRVMGQKWNWAYSYTHDGKTIEIGGPDQDCMKSVDTPDRDVECNQPLRVPAGKPVKLIMNSKDVLHSFFVPDFRMKKDVVPGRYTVAWFEAPEAGTHPIFCTEYCGDRHGYMYSRVEVMPQAEFDAWIQKEADSISEDGPSGEKLFALKGCAGCHSIDGSKLVGPTLKGKYGAMESLADGSQVKIDDDYIRESIMVPAAKIVAGYPPAMPPYQGQLSDAEVNKLIDYIKTLAE